MPEVGESVELRIRKVNTDNELRKSGPYGWVKRVTQGMSVTLCVVTAYVISHRRHNALCHKSLAGNDLQRFWHFAVLS